MKKQAVICLMLCGLFLLIGWGSVFDADFPPPPFESLSDYSIVTGTGITDAFLQNEEIRSLFETIAYNSLLLEPGRYTIVKYLDSYAYYSGREELPHVVFDNEVMEDAVFKLTEYYPGMCIDIDRMNVYVFADADDENMGVFFSVNRIDAEKSEDIFIEEILYTPAEIDHPDYESIGENWYSTTYFMPMPFEP